MYKHIAAHPMPDPARIHELRERFFSASQMIQRTAARKVQSELRRERNIRDYIIVKESHGKRLIFCLAEHIPEVQYATDARHPQFAKWFEALEGQHIDYVLLERLHPDINSPTPPTTCGMSEMEIMAVHLTQNTPVKPTLIDANWGNSRAGIDSMNRDIMSSGYTAKDIATFRLFQGVLNLVRQQNAHYENFHELENALSPYYTHVVIPELACLPALPESEIPTFAETLQEMLT